MFIDQEIGDRVSHWASLKRWERRELGRDLRRLDFSYEEILGLIPAHKSTLSGWCRGVELSEEQRNDLRARNNFQAGREATGSILRKRNLDRIEGIRAEARAEALTLVTEPLWVAGVVAYWAEGSKKENMLGFSNSDPQMIRLFINWGCRYLGLTRDRFTIAMNLHSGQEHAERMRFWSEQTSLSPNQFRQTYVKPEGTGHRKNILYNGTATIRVTKSNEAFYRVMGWIEFLMSPASTFCKLPLGR